MLIVQASLAQESEQEIQHNLSLSLSTVQLASDHYKAVLFNPRIMYRLDFGKIAIRVQSQYLPMVENPEASAYGPSFQQSSSALFGLQYSKTWGRFELSGFLDLGYGGILLHSGTSSKVYAQKSGIKGESGLGFSYRLANQWHIGFESAATYLYGQGFGYPYSVDVDIRRPQGLVKVVGGEFIFNPLNALWLTYSFGKE